MNAAYFFFGGVKVFVEYAHSTAFLNLCMYYCIPYTNFTTVTDGIELVIRGNAYKKLKKEACARGIEFKVIKKSGIPSFIDRYKLRVGAFIGIILSAALIYLSQNVIWDINVTGNESLSGGEVRELLRSEGLFVGSYIPTANTDRIENKIMLKTDNISWMSINISGTVANVQIREVVRGEEIDASANPANLIANKDGIIEEVRIFKGQVMVSPGQTVSKGDVIVSGIYESERHGIRYTRATGQVYARTIEEYYIEIPFEYQGKRYTGEEYCDKYLNFFDYSINISKNSRNDGALYDKIDIVENYCLPWGLPTPIEKRTVKYSAYETVTMTRSAEEAEELAYFELSRILGDMAEESTMISKTVTPIIGENSFVLYCKIGVIEDIAELSEIDTRIFEGEAAN